MSRMSYLAMGLAILLLSLTACNARPVVGSAPATSRPTESQSAGQGSAHTPSATIAILANLPAIQTPSSTATPAPATPIPSSTPTLVPTLRQLTSGGCCVNPTWRADGEAVRFLDKPSAEAPAGIYEVIVGLPGPVSAGTLLTTTLNSGPGDERFRITPGPETTIIEERATGRVHTLPGAVSQLMTSPDGTQVVWQVRTEDAPGPGTLNEIAFWVAVLDGSAPRLLFRARGASLQGWLGDGALLLQVRDEPPSNERRLLRVELVDGRTTELDRAARFSGMAISRGGAFVAYYISIDYDHPERNGLWLLDTASGSKYALPTAAYRWRDATRLLLVPLELRASAMRVQEYDATTATLRDLTDPNPLPLHIANNDWIVSPDGTRVVFVSAADNNLWVLEVGE